MAVISLDLAPTLCCPSTRRESAPYALTMWMGRSSSVPLPRTVLPSMAMTCAGSVGSEAIQAMKQVRNCSGSMAAHTRAKVFLHGMPASKG